MTRRLRRAPPLRRLHRLTKHEAALATAIAPAHECEEFRRAKRLKATIEEFWSARGQAIEVRIVEASVRIHNCKCRFYVLASDTIDGLPAGAAS